MKFEGLLDNIIQLHLASQQAAGQTLLHLMNLRNWLVGAWIVEYEQGGEDRDAADARHGAGVELLRARQIVIGRQSAVPARRTHDDQRGEHSGDEAGDEDDHAGVPEVGGLCVPSPGVMIGTTGR